MATYRESVCKYYVALGECSKGRDACHKGYCQRCNKYVPRAKVKKKNEKREKLSKIRKGESHV